MTQQEAAQTKPEVLIDMLCRHPWYDNNPRPTKEDFHRLRTQCGNPAIDEMFLAITNLVARADEFPNPPMHTLRIIGFRKGVCDIGPAKIKPTREGKSDTGTSGYWASSPWAQEWQETWDWFSGLSSDNQRQIKASCELWLTACLFAAHIPAMFGPRSPGRAWLMHHRKKILNPNYGDFCAQYSQILQESHDRNNREFQESRRRRSAI